MANVRSTNAALAIALRQVPGCENGGDCICVSPSTRSGILNLHRVRCNSGTDHQVVRMNSELIPQAFAPEFIERIAGENSCPVFLYKKSGSGILRRMLQLVTADLTPALVDGKRIEVRFNPT